MSHINGSLKQIKNWNSYDKYGSGAITCLSSKFD